MPRAKRYYIPGCVWHITHRCHKKEFLLKFRRDRKRWLELLYKAKQRYGLVVLNYIAISNHIHLLVSDDGHRDTIAKSMQMVAAQTGQEYNRRKNRRGAFWEDRYHATAIEGGSHLLNCIAYIEVKVLLKKIRQELGLRAIHRKANQISNGFELRESEFSYDANFSPQNVCLSPENGYPWRIFK
jgi:REP element-mobilizing transposase RayT